MPRVLFRGFDSEVVDSEDRTVALVRVKADHVKDWAKVLAEPLAAAMLPVNFVLAVDMDFIRLYQTSGADIGEPMLELDTGNVLRRYDPAFPRNRIFDPYLRTLVEAWLTDLAYHWKSQEPPCAEEMRRVGLLEKIEGGTTETIER